MQQKQQIENAKDEDSKANWLLEQLSKLNADAAADFMKRMRMGQDQSFEALMIAAIAAIIGFLFGGPVGAVAFAGAALAATYSEGYFDPKPEVAQANADAAELAAGHDVENQMATLNASLEKGQNPERQVALEVKRYLRAVVSGGQNAEKLLDTLPAQMQAKVGCLSDYEREKVLQMPTRKLAENLSQGVLLSAVVDPENVVEFEPKATRQRKPARRTNPSSQIGRRLV